MDIERTLAIIAALAEGRDPVTGRPLAADHVCQLPDVIRALHAAQDIVMREARRERRLQRARLTLPGNTGKSWSAEEDAILLQRFKTGASVSDLATLHARTTGAIRARLEKLGQGPGLERQTSPASVRRPYHA